MVGSDVEGSCIRQTGCSLRLYFVAIVAQCVIYRSTDEKDWIWCDASESNTILSQIVIPAFIIKTSRYDTTQCLQKL